MFELEDINPSDTWAIIPPIEGLNGFRNGQTRGSGPDLTPRKHKIEIPETFRGLKGLSN